MNVTCVPPMMLTSLRTTVPPTRDGSRTIPEGPNEQYGTGTRVAGGHAPLSMTLLPHAGIGLGRGGVGNVTVCGSCTRPPVMLAPPLNVAALTPPVLQLPTPVRGVDSVPLMAVVAPTPSRLPLVPTLPSL